MELLRGVRVAEEDKVDLYPWRRRQERVEADSAGSRHRSSAQGRACAYVELLQAARSLTTSRVTDLGMIFSHARAYSTILYRTTMKGLAAGVVSYGEMTGGFFCQEYLGAASHPGLLPYTTFLERAEYAAAMDSAPLASHLFANGAYCNIVRAVSTCTTGSEAMHNTSTFFGADYDILPDFASTSFPRALTRIAAIRPSFELAVPLLDVNPVPRNLTVVFKFFWNHVDGVTDTLRGIAFQEPLDVAVAPTSPDLEVLLSILAPEKVISFQRRGIFETFVSHEVAQYTGNWGVTKVGNVAEKWDWNGHKFARYAFALLRLANLVAARWPDALQIVSEDWMTDPVAGTERLIDYVTPPGAPARPDSVHEELVAFADREIVPLDPRGERARSLHLMTKYCANYGEFAAAVVAEGFGELIGM
jgi:hypothetical protein